MRSVERFFLWLGALSLGLVVLVSVDLLETKWLIAVVVGFLLLTVAILSGRFERFLFGLFFFILPFNADIKLAFAWCPAGAQELEIAATHIILGILCVPFILRFFAEPHLRVFWPAGATSLVCLIVWSAFSVLNARDPRLTMILIVHFAWAFLGFFYVANHVKTEKDLWLVTRSLMAGLLVECLIAWAQHASGSSLGLEMLGERDHLPVAWMGPEKVHRIVGTFGHPNGLGAYLTAVLPLVLAMNFSPLRVRIRLVIFGLFVLGGATLILTLNRSAWVTTALAFLGLLGWMVFSKRGASRWIQLLVVLAALGLMVAAFAPTITARLIEDDRGAAISRIPMMQVAWAMVRDHPFLGVGLNNYTSVTHLYEAFLLSPLSRDYLYETRVHNAYLLLAAEAGLVALVFLVWFLGQVVSSAQKRIRRLPEGLIRLVLSGFLSSFAALLLNVGAHPGYFATNTFLWIYAGIFVSKVGSE